MYCAAVCFYATDIHSHSLGLGKHDDSLERAGEIKGELLHIWGRQDPHVPLAGRNLIKARLDEVGANFQWLEVNGAHAFMRDEGYRYDPELAAHLSEYDAGPAAPEIGTVTDQELKEIPQKPPEDPSSDLGFGRVVSSAA